MRTTASLETIRQLIEGRHENPFELLGPHEIDQSGRRALAVRAFLPSSDQAWVVDPAHGNRTLPMRRIHPAGLFEAICPLPQRQRKRRLAAVHASRGRGRRQEDHDHARSLLLSALADRLRPLLVERRPALAVLQPAGAQLRKIDGVDGVNFAVWAPNATSVSVVGDFNNWDGRRHPMRKHIPSGFWELFVPGLGEGTLYKYQIRHNDWVFEKSDPFGFAAEVPPRTASKVADLNRYAWHDADWMTRRPETNWLEQPLSFYEVHLGSWKRPGDEPHAVVELSRSGPSVGRVLQGDRLHARRVAAGERASAVGQLGIPDDRLLRGHQPLRHAPGFHVLRRRAAPERHRRDFGLGAGAFSPRRSRAAAVRRHGALRARRSAPRRAPRLGHAHLQLRPARGPQLPHLQRPVLDGQVPRRRHSRGRRGLDAVPRLQPRGRRLAAQPVRRAGEHRGHLLPQGVERAGPLPAPRRADDRRGIDGLGGRVAAHVPRRAGIQPEVEHGLDERHPHLHAPRSHPPPLPSRRADLQPDLRLSRELRAADVARRGGARQGIAAGPDARRPVAEVRQLAALVQLHVDAPGQEAAVHGQRLRPVERVELRRQPAMAPFAVGVAPRACRSAWPT